MDTHDLIAYLRERFDTSSTQVPLRGGPHDGVCHELPAGLPMPTSLCLPRDEDAPETILDWYAVIDGVGYYDRSEVWHEHHAEA